MLKSSYLLYYYIHLSIARVCEVDEEPKADDITEVEAPKSDSPTSTQSSSKVEHYRYPWEKTPEAWNTAMKIAQHNFVVSIQLMIVEATRI